jgi:hypothetical protein
MIKLRALHLSNFRSFKKVQHFTFPEGPGLYFMWGDNQVEPRLDANGAGKSTVWKALTWLFFGKTSEGLKAGDACNWDVAKGTDVRLEFSIDGGLPEFLIRTWSPNTWVHRDLFGNVHDLAKDPTNPVLSALRLEFQSFLSCILMAQGQPMFLDLKADAKASLFAEVMGLDRWVGYSEKASTRAKDVDRDLRSVEVKISSLRGRIEAAREVDVASKVAEWEAGRQTRLRSLEQEYRSLIQRQKDLKERLVTRQQEAEAARGEYRAALDRSDAAVGDLHRAHGSWSAKAGDHNCPTCGQKVNGLVASAIDKVNDAAKAAKAALQFMDDMDAAVRNCERDILSIDKTLDGLEDREDQIIAEANPFTRMQDDATATLAALQDDMYDAEEKQEALSSQHSIYSGWVRWFKEIRLGLIGEALEQLEIEVNSCVTALGLVDWELQFDVDKETAKGTLQRGFTVSVLSPHNTKAVPWEAWSGGESQRLRVAVNMGLSNLIRQRTGCDLPLEVWDEPTNHMSGQGVADLLDCLKARALNEQRQIWVVDHRTLGYAGFDGNVGVVKKTTGSEFAVPSYRSQHGAKSSSSDGRKVDDVPRRRASA